MAEVVEIYKQRKYEFDKCGGCYHGNLRVRKLPTYEQFLVLAFARLTWRESLRDIETCLASFGPKLYHAVSLGALTEARYNGHGDKLWLTA